MAGQGHHIYLQLSWMIVLLSCLDTTLCFGIDTTCQYKPDGLYRHGLSCKRFIHCTHGLPNYKVCPIFLEFNERRKICDTPENARCMVRLAAPLKSPKPAKKDLCQNVKYAVFGVPDDCRSYVVCINGKKMKKKCPTGLRFHPKYKVCVYGKATDCMKNPFCLKLPDGIYSHPKTCKSYISCTRGMTLVKDCPPLMVFDKVKKRCGWKWNSVCQVGTHQSYNKHPQSTKSYLQPTIIPPTESENTVLAVMTDRTRNALTFQTKNQPTLNIQMTPVTNDRVTVHPSSTPAVPLGRQTPPFLKFLKIAAKAGKGVHTANTGSKMETYVISGQGYPAVPVKGRKYKLAEKFKTVRINLHRFRNSKELMRNKHNNAPVKVLDISYDTRTLQPPTAAKTTLSRSTGGSDKAKMELQKYIQSMNAQVNLFNKQLSDVATKNSVRKSTLDEFAPSLKHRQMLSRLLKEFVKNKLKKFKPTYEEAFGGTSSKSESKPASSSHSEDRPDILHMLGSSNKNPRRFISKWGTSAVSRMGLDEQKHARKATELRRTNPGFPELERRDGFVVNEKLRGMPESPQFRRFVPHMSKGREPGQQKTAPRKYFRQLQIGSMLKNKEKLNAPSQSTLFAPRSKLSAICSTVFDPVCGSDFQTYFNDCHLALTSCSRGKKKSVKKLHDGPCVSKS